MMDYARWLRIRWTYTRALAAMEALPGVPLRDIFYAEIRLPRAGELVHSEFVTRSDWPERASQLNAQYPHPHCMAVDCNMEPYLPRKGEMTFKQWLRLQNASAAHTLDNSKVSPCETETVTASPSAG